MEKRFLKSDQSSQSFFYVYLLWDLVHSWPHFIRRLAWCWC